MKQLKGGDNRGEINLNAADQVLGYDSRIIEPGNPDIIIGR